MLIKLLSQGYEAESENSVGHQLIKLLADKEYHTFIGISAFASQAGIRGLAKYIKEAKTHLKNITIVTGVDQKGTSKEALEEILAIDIDSFVFYQPSVTIFHPKIYLFEGNEKTELIIGSSNLTSQGLFTNIETSLHITIDNSIERDIKIVEQLKEYFKDIFNYTDPNLKRLNNKLIADLVDSKIVPTEDERRAAQDKDDNATRVGTENNISNIFPKRPIAKIPNEFRGIKKQMSIKTDTNVDKDDFESTLNNGELVWESGELTERDLNIPKGKNTNPTGSMLLKKGKMNGIDQRHYFRDTVFAMLKWGQDKKATHIEIAIATFEIVIDGEPMGTFNLTITHNTKTDTPTYKQKNSMTQIRWGNAKKVVAKESLIGKSASLYKTLKVDHFILAIQ
jgi:HKD family nuclease